MRISNTRTMNNLDTLAGWRYHDGTKHPYGPMMDPYHRFDPAGQPWLFKKYLEVESIPLPTGSAPSGVAALESLSNSPSAADQPARLDLEVLARLLYYSAGLIAIPQREQTAAGERTSPTGLSTQRV